MTERKPQDMIDRLDELLDRERLYLLEGDLEEIAPIAAQKEELIETLNGLAPAEAPDLGSLQDKLARNQMLLDGALQGIRKVATRLAALRRIRRSLETYDASGRKQTIQGEVAHRVEKRA